jgi:hypothetical protein
MRIDISRKNEARLRAIARAIPLSPEEIPTKIELGFSESEHDEVVDGETFCTGLLAELDDMEYKRRAD